MQAAAADGDAVDALFSEAFALLEGPTPTSPSPSPQPAPARKRTHGEGSASRRKRWLDELRDEETVLRGELARLRGRVAHPEARERALAERVKRRRAEQECEQLREVLYQHTQFLRGLRGFLSIGSPCSLSLNLYHHLHSFTRLPRDASARQIEYAALRRDQRFRAAIELLQRETAALPVAGIHSQTDFAHTPDEPCAITTKRVYVMDDCDVPMVLRAACVAVHDIVAHCRSYKWVGVAGESVDAEALAASGGQYCVTSIRRTSELDAEGFSVESRSLTMHKTTDGSAVMLWDFVDEDELHPLDESPDIFRQGVGACLVRREVCSDGVERTVYREVSTRRYEYRGQMPPSASVVRYFASKRDVMHDYERLFHDLMVEQIERDKAGAAAAAQRPLLECSV